MSLTDKKRRYVAARLSGLSGAKAAIAAGYSEKGAAQAAARLNKDPDVAAALQRAGQVNNVNQNVNHTVPPKTDPEQEEVAIGLEALGLTSDPKKVLVALMNDTNEDPKLRLEAAKALMPFTHHRKGEGGKKEQQAEAARKVSNKFASATPPKLLSINGRRQ